MKDGLLLGQQKQIRKLREHTHTHAHRGPHGTSETSQRLRLVLFCYNPKNPSSISS